MADVNPHKALAAIVAQYQTQQDAARALLMSPSYLSELLRGQRPFTPAVLGKLGLRRVVRYQKA